LQRLKEWERGAEFPASFVPAMFLLDQRDRGRLTTDEVASALRLIESYLVRRTLVDTSNKSDLVLREVPGALAGATDVVAGLRQYLSGAKAPWPDDTEVRRAILNKPFYYHGKAHQRVFILRRLEESYDQPERVDWTRPVYSIEHVLPQGLTPEWTAALQPDATRFGVATRELHRLVVHTLGNLTLTGKNGPLSNRPFSDKRRILNESALVMNRRIAEREEWNSTEIERRGRELAERVFQIWPGPVDGAPSVVADEWTTLHRALALAPAGGWLPLASLASLLGKRPRELASYLVAEAPANWYRVLGAAGSVLEGNGANGASQRSLLEAEGVVFSADGLAWARRRSPRTWVRCSPPAATECYSSTSIPSRASRSPSTPSSTSSTRSSHPRPSRHGSTPSTVPRTCRWRASSPTRRLSRRRWAATVSWASSPLVSNSCRSTCA